MFFFSNTATPTRCGAIVACCDGLDAAIDSRCLGSQSFQAAPKKRCTLFLHPSSHVPLACEDGKGLGRGCCGSGRDRRRVLHLTLPDTSAPHLVSPFCCACPSEKVANFSGTLKRLYPHEQKTLPHGSVCGTHTVLSLSVVTSLWSHAPRRHKVHGHLLHGILPQWEDRPLNYGLNQLAKQSAVRSPHTQYYTSRRWCGPQPTEPTQQRERGGGERGGKGTPDSCQQGQAQPRTPIPHVRPGFW